MKAKETYKCYFCKGKVAEQHVDIDYRWGDTLVVIKNVPAGVCQQCGEKYLSSDVYKELERMAKSKSHLTGKMSVDILAYEVSSAA
ncbi:MAG: type II toxin-antitoxin system MqsA family antitoxin [Nitrospirae bacterium]|nr:type II toxin-antitoxin system MqsA family antitoxin [Nitrospirota bacterium]